MSGLEKKTLKFAMMMECELRHVMSDFDEERRALITDYDSRTEQAFDLVSGLIDDLLGTVPSKDLIWLKKELPLLEHLLRYKPVGKPPAEYVWIRDGAINEMLNVIVSDKCALCTDAHDEHASAAHPDTISTMRKRKRLKSMGVHWLLSVNGCVKGGCDHDMPVQGLR